MQGQMRDTMPHKKPGIAIVIAVKPSKKDTKKKYAGDAMPNAMNKAWGLIKGTPYSGKEMNTQFRRGTYPFRAGSANFMRGHNPIKQRSTLSPDAEAGWTRMQNPTTRSILQRFGQRGAQNVAASKLPLSQRWGASVPDESSSFVIGGPSSDEGNFPLAPEISPVKQGQATQFDPSASNNRTRFFSRRQHGYQPLDNPRDDEKLENMYGSRLREGFDQKFQ